MWAANRGGAAALCLILGVAVWLVVRDAWVPVPMQYDYDEGVFAATADAVAHGGHLYRDVFLSQPPLFVLVIRAMFALWGTSLAAARITVVVLSVVWLIAILAILWTQGSPWGGLLAVCLLLGRATFLKAAQTVQMEVPAEALACAAVGLAVWGLRRPGYVWWAGAGILATLAAMTKLTAVTAAIPLIGAAASEPAPESRWRWRMLATGALLAFAVFLPVVGSAGFVDQVFTFHLALARTLHEPASTHVASIGKFLADQWPLSVAALVGAWRAVAGGAVFERALVAWFAADVIALAALTPLWAHHLIILISPMGLLAGTALRRGRERLDLAATAGVGRQSNAPSWLSELVLGTRPGARPVARLVTLTFLAACTMAYLGLGMSAVDKAIPSPQLEHVVRRITEAVPPEGKVLTDDPMVSFLAGRRVADGFVDSSQTRIWTGRISEKHLTSALHAEGTDAVVLWRGTFQRYFPAFESAATRVFPFAETVPGRGILLLKHRGATDPP
jgi:dolichyl-phosphate-mannose-protein mannosyltransferase